MNALDKVIGWISPERGLRRLAAREWMDRLAHQSYDGARGGRRTDGWTTGGSSANSAVLGALPKLIARSRDLCRNDEHMISARRVVSEYAVGTGIELQLDDPKWQALWDEWVKQSDADGLLSFHGLQLLAVKTLFESGSILIRKRWRRPEDGLVVPLQLQALEPDYLDSTKDGELNAGRGWVQSGIEFNSFGRRSGYWLYRIHPGETGSSFFARGGTTESSFVAASEILHAFVVERPGQVQGAPWTHGVIIRARDLADYEGAELFRKKIEACMVGFVSQAGGIMGPGIGPRPSGAPSSAGQGGSPRPEQFEPGTYVYGQPGESITFNDPKGSTSYGPYVRTQAERLGAGVGVPYHKLTGDLAQANYSSLKAGSNQFEQGMDVLRWLTLIPRVCDPVLQWFFDAAEIAKVAPGKRPNYEWQAPPYPEVEPYKEASARVLDMRAGVRTPQEVIRSRGSDPRRQLDQIEEWNREVDKRGIVLDTDPRRVSAAGLMQAQPNGSGNPGKGSDDDEE